MEEGNIYRDRDEGISGPWERELSVQKGEIKYGGAEAMVGWNVLEDRGNIQDGVEIEQSTVKACQKDQPMWVVALSFPRALGRKEKISTTATEEMTKRRYPGGGRTERKVSVWGMWKKVFKKQEGGE